MVELYTNGINDSETSIDTDDMETYSSKTHTTRDIITIIENNTTADGSINGNTSKKILEDFLSTEDIIEDLAVVFDLPEEIIEDIFTISKTVNDVISGIEDQI
jgi:hypothetical protein